MTSSLRPSPVAAELPPLDGYFGSDMIDESVDQSIYSANYAKL